MFPMVNGFSLWEVECLSEADKWAGGEVVGRKEVMCVANTSVLHCSLLRRWLSSFATLAAFILSCTASLCLKALTIMSLVMWWKVWNNFDSTKMQHDGRVITWNTLPLSSWEQQLHFFVKQLYMNRTTNLTIDASECYMKLYFDVSPPKNHNSGVLVK